MEKKTIASKLAEARSRIGIKKTGTNAFAKYSYYQIDVIYAESKDIFNELGIMTVERVDLFDIGGNLYQKFFLDIINTDDMNDKITFEVITEPNTMKGAQPAQEAGSTITYATKYLYGLALMIDDGKSDPDANNTHNEKDLSPKKNVTRTEKINLANAKGTEAITKFIEEYNKTSEVKLNDKTMYWKNEILDEFLSK